MVKDIHAKRDSIVEAVSEENSVRDIISNIKSQFRDWETNSVIAPGDWESAKQSSVIHVSDIEDGVFRVLFDTPEKCRCLEITDSNVLFREADWDTDTEDALESTTRDWYEDTKSPD